MPQPKKYANAAERQAAYRERHAEAKASGLDSEPQRVHLRSTGDNRGQPGHRGQPPVGGEKVAPFEQQRNLPL